MTGFFRKSEPGDYSISVYCGTQPSTDLCQSAKEVINGLVDANLGGNLFKKRSPLQGLGKVVAHVLSLHSGIMIK
ncbi:type II toxin-antitoxin system RelE/ParE family toxin [Photorhabdus heterorhabditis subsp. aluminescens]|nr:type II toxin-antitoxin system RelE/ParE family toxin [Photorhabdus heterorhabditis subsp. aluminescens]